MAITITSVTPSGADALVVAYSADAGETRARVSLRRVSDNVVVATQRRSFSGNDSVTFSGLAAGVSYRATVAPLRTATLAGVAAGASTTVVANFVFEGTGV
jgi:hypothetical protein